MNKHVYFLYSALLNHKQQDQQQSAATMPSKPAVTRKCQCFKNPTPLMSAAVHSSVCVPMCVRVWACRSLEQSQLVLCTPKLYERVAARNTHIEQTHTWAAAASRRSGAILLRLHPEPPQQQVITQLVLSESGTTLPPNITTQRPVSITDVSLKKKKKKHQPSDCAAAHTNPARNNNKKQWASLISI